MEGKDLSWNRILLYTMKKIILIVSAVGALFIASLLSHSKYYSLFLGERPPAENLFLQKIEMAGESFLFMDLLIALIFSFLAIMFVILAFILMNRRRMEGREKRKTILMERYQDFLLDEISGELPPEERKRRLAYFQRIVVDGFSRQILIDQISDLSIHLPEEKREILRRLYYSLGLIQDTLNKIRRGSWNVVIKGFKEISALGIRDLKEEIKKHINSKDSNVRIEALITLVYLDRGSSESFSWLDSLEDPLSLWEQITLHQLMIDHGIKPPDFSKWVLSPNSSISKFSLRMIREYSQLNSKERVEKLLYHSEPDVRKLSIEVMGDLHMPLSGILKKRFKHETYDNSLEILKSLGKISDPSTIGFLQKVIDSHDDVQIQIEATKAVKSIPAIGEEALEKMMKSDYKNYKIIIKHVLDKRIS